MMILTTAGVFAAIKSHATQAKPAPQAVTISIDGLHHQVDMRSLPEFEIGTPY
jgi:hypothetical protein